MFDDGGDAIWRSRRCAAVTTPLGELRSDGGDSPSLAPEIQLFYKAKAPRPKDELDFAAFLPLLDAPRQVWLRQAIMVAYGSHHRSLGRFPSPAVRARG